MLDREIADAPPRVELIRPHDRPGGAGRDAPGTGAAVISRRCVRLDPEIGQDLPEEKPGAPALEDHVRVLSDPADAGTLRPRAIEHGAGVHVREPLRLGTHRRDRAREEPQLAADPLVIVPAPGVARDPPARRGAGIARGPAPAVVGNRDRDHGPGARKDRTRVRAPFGIPRDPAHRPVSPGGEPRAEPFPVLRFGGLREADRSESERDRLLAYAPLQRVRV